jgi:ketosteroid isomerase-like protein
LSEENLAIIREGFRAFAQGEVAALADLLDPEVEWQALEDPTPKHGFDGVLESIAGWFEVWDDFHIDLEELIDAGESVVAVVKERGRVSGSDREVTERFFQVWTMRSGKVIAFREYKTRDEAFEAVGMSDKDARAETA